MHFLKIILTCMTYYSQFVPQKSAEVEINTNGHMAEHSQLCAVIIVDCVVTEP